MREVWKINKRELEDDWKFNRRRLEDDSKRT